MISEQTILDQAQRHAALNPSESFIVQAPAGSGKTELLIQRFLTLLSHVNHPDEILAITFTKKAANEMRMRVLSALQFAQTSPEPSAAHQKQTWRIAKRVIARDTELGWHLFNNPNQLRIQTIDSLCSFLTKQLPLLANFGAQPDVLQDPTPLYSLAVQEVLLHVEESYEWSEAIATLLLHVDNDLNKLHDLFVNLLAKRDQWIPYIHLSSSREDIREILEENLAAVITDHLKLLRANFPRDLVTETLAIANFVASNTGLVELHLHELPGYSPDEKSIWIALSQLLFTKSLEWRKRLDVNIGFPALASLKNPQEKALHISFRKRLTEVISKLSEHENIKALFTELHLLPEATYNNEQWEILQSLLSVLKVLTAQLRLSFQQFGQIDFIENTLAALYALGSDEKPTDLALALDYQIKHILVDEFQDTSICQHQLLEKLIIGWEENDGRTLFVVGDPMQSIYRFREAEVGLFIRMFKHGIGHLNLTPLTLTMNFRSQQKIVNWNNKHFSKIFPSYNDIATGAVTYAPSHAIQSPLINNDIFIKGFVNTSPEVQAQAIVEMIQKNKQPHQSVAILVRSRSHLQPIIPFLKKVGLNYRAIDIDPLTTRQAIQDLFSLTCALLHLADRISWLAILRAPWCGLTLQDLHTLAHDNPNNTIWEQLQRPELLEQLTADGQKRLARILPILSAQLAARERQCLRQWVESAWLLIGGPACLPDPIALQDASRFFELLDQFSQQEQALNIDRLRQNMQQLYAASDTNEDAIQIMTIHSAKGLEFDMVILPYLDKKMPYDDKSLFQWMERPLSNQQNALILAPIHATGDNDDAIYEYINHQQKIKTRFETTRLLYVATTRAKKSLHLYFDCQKNDAGDFRITTGSFLEKLWPVFQDQIEYDIQTDAMAAEPIVVKKALHRLISDWENPLKAYSANTAYKHQQNEGFQLRDTSAQIIGTVTHQILQRISQQGLSWWKKLTNSEQNSLILQALNQSGLPPHRLTIALSQIQTGIHHCMTDERGQWILHDHSYAQSELALTAIIENKVENLIIDRTFVHEGIRWIIDYKTTALTQQALEDFLIAQQNKYQLKMQKYAQAFAQLESYPVKLGLYFPVIPAWKSWACVSKPTSKLVVEEAIA